MDSIELTTSEEDTHFVRQKLNDYNFERVPPDNHETLNLVVRGDHALIAGLVGDTAWDWLYISLFWVDPSERSHGLGRRILAKAEEIARQRGCRNANLETHDFQSLEFYQKRGYIVFGTLADYPAGHTKYYLRKSLAE